MAEILHELSINASAGRIYRALSEQSGLSQWWKRDVIAEPVIGSIAEFTFNRGLITLQMKIVKLIPNRGVIWHCMGGDREWIDTQIAFDTHVEDKMTTLLFEHRGWRNTQGGFATCSFDWARYLMSLRSYLEKGKGYPARG